MGLSIVTTKMLSKTSSTGRIKPKKDLTGQKFNRLIVKKFIGWYIRTGLLKNKPRVSNVPYYLCECNCLKKTKKIVAGSSLTSGLTQSCGCYHKEMAINAGKKNNKNLPGISSFNHYYNEYKRQAARLNRKFELDKNTFSDLVYQNCHYCRCIPNRKHPPDKYKYNTGTIYVNGIDRINPDYGYVLDNVVSCCTNCNFSKRDLSYDDYQEWLKNIVNNHKYGFYTNVLTLEYSGNTIPDIYLLPETFNFKKSYLSPGVSAVNTYYSSYKCRARKDGIEFKLDRGVFNGIIFKDCHYCKSSPYKIIPSDITYAKHKTNGRVIVNGIDRVDSNKGYIAENIVPCCSLCNYAKRNLTYEMFVSFLKIIINNRQDLLL